MELTSIALQWLRGPLKILGGEDDQTRAELIATQLTIKGVEIRTQSLGMVLRVESPAGLVVGSAVAVGTHWALAVAHCFRQRTGSLTLSNADKKALATVEAIYWRDGSSFLFDKHKVWPVPATGKGGRMDELVLLRTSDAIADEDAARIIDWGVLKCPDAVLLCGFGKDEVGNYPTGVGALALEYYADSRTRRGILRREATVVGQAMPYSDYSGGPVFEVSKDRGISLRGLHVSRTKARDAAPFESRDPMEEVACFLPLQPGDKPWFDRITSRPLDRPSADAFKPQRFTLRQRFSCYTLNSTKDLDGTWYLYDASPREEFLFAGGTVVVQASDTGQSAWVTIHGRNKSSSFSFTANLFDLNGLGNVAIAGTKDGTVFSPKIYLFLENSGVLDRESRRRIRVELFFKNTMEEKPGEKNIKKGWLVEDPIPVQLPQRPRHGFRDYAELVPPAPDLMDDGDDQDEEGDGYET